MARIKSEIELIEKVTKKVRDRKVMVGIGDDAAVVKSSSKNMLVLTTDMFVEEDHFSLKWWNPEEIGSKAIEANVSDIAAMGAMPKYALISLCLQRKTKLEFVKKLYKGIYSSAKRYGIGVIGGDITHGSQLAINVAMTGEVKEMELCKRSDAKMGDYILVSGELGSAAAGLKLFQNGMKGFRKIKDAHLKPRAQLKKARKLCRFVNAMEDVSDGLAAEVKNICRESKCGAVIFWDRIPVPREVQKVAKMLNKDAREFALFGGEDFELVFSCNRKNLKKVRGTIVGRIVSGRKVLLEKKGMRTEILRSGYDHFSSLG